MCVNSHSRGLLRSSKRCARRVAREAKTMRLDTSPVHRGWESAFLERCARCCGFSPVLCCWRFPNREALDVRIE